MSKIYGLMADLHLHRWSAFAGVDEEGMNTRLKGLLMEIERCAAEVRKAEGNLVVIAGDVFHVRGSVAPTVLNATRDMLAHCVAHYDVHFLILAGNHDLEGKESARLSSAITALESKGVRVCNAPTVEDGRVLVPWFESITDLKAQISAMATEVLDAGCDLDDYDLILHAPIDGVIAGLPDHGLTPEYLASLGFKRVFSGHYHNHKVFDGGVHSIGALAHHTWSDVGSKAGFLLVTPDEVNYRASHLPRFVDLGELAVVDEADLFALVDQNFIRVKVEAAKSKDVEDAKQELLKLGAKAVLVQPLPKVALKPGEGRASVIASGASLEVSVSSFIDQMKDVVAEEVKQAAMKVLAEATGA